MHTSKYKLNNFHGFSLHAGAIASTLFRVWFSHFHSNELWWHEESICVINDWTKEDSEVPKEQYKTFLQSQTLIILYLLRKSFPLQVYFKRNNALKRLRKKHLHTCTLFIISYLWHKHQQTLYNSACPSDCCDYRIISQVPSKGYCWNKVSHGTAWHQNQLW